MKSPGRFSFFAQNRKKVRSVCTDFFNDMVNYKGSIVVQSYWYSVCSLYRIYCKVCSGLAKEFGKGERVWQTDLY